MTEAVTECRAGPDLDEAGSRRSRTTSRPRPRAGRQGRYGLARDVGADAAAADAAAADAAAADESTPDIAPVASAAAAARRAGDARAGDARADDARAGDARARSPPRPISPPRPRRAWRAQLLLAPGLSDADFKQRPDGSFAPVAAAAPRASSRGDANADGLWGWDDFNRLQRDLDQAGVADGAEWRALCETLGARLDSAQRGADCRSRCTRPPTTSPRTCVLDARTAELAAAARAATPPPTARGRRRRRRRRARGPTATRRRAPAAAAASATRAELEAMAERLAAVEGQLAEAAAREAAVRTRLEKVEQELVVTRKARARGSKFWSCSRMFGPRSAKVDQEKGAAP